MSFRDCSWGHLGFPGGSAGEASACSAGDLGLIPALGSPAGEGRVFWLRGPHGLSRLMGRGGPRQSGSGGAGLRARTQLAGLQSAESWATPGVSGGVGREGGRRGPSGSVEPSRRVAFGVQVDLGGLGLGLSRSPMGAGASVWGQSLAAGRGTGQPRALRDAAPRCAHLALGWAGPQVPGPGRRGSLNFGHFLGFPWGRRGSLLSLVWEPSASTIVSFSACDAVIPT